MLRRRAQLRQWPLEVPATRQGCSKDRQEAQTLPLLCVMHHRCTKKKKRTHKRHRKLLYKDKPPCGVLRCRRRATSVLVAQRVVQQQAVIFRGPSTRHVSALSRNTNANRAEKQVADNEMCHAPANFPFSAGLFLCRVLSLSPHCPLFMSSSSQSVGGQRRLHEQKEPRAEYTVFAGDPSSTLRQACAGTTFYNAPPKGGAAGGSGVSRPLCLRGVVTVVGVGMKGDLRGGGREGEVTMRCRPCVLCEARCADDDGVGGG